MKEKAYMKIIVPIKHILDPQGITIRRDKERIFINREDYIIDPGSKAALEAALRLQDADDCDVVALCMGPERADDALREALAMGCDAAYLLSDEAFEEVDVSATVRILAAAINELGGAEVVITGRESRDTGSGQVGARLAGALDYAQVADAYALAVRSAALEATRRWGDGYAKIVVQLPVVVTVAPEAFPPRLAPGDRIMNAYQKWDVQIWSAADLDLGDGGLDPLLEHRGESFPPPLEVGEQFRGDPQTVAADIVAMLRQKRLIEQAGGRHGL
jgi:electron transfer flavoprotein beta subunit